MLLYSQTLRDRGIEECFKYSSYHSEYTGAAALSVGESSIDFPSQLRRNTVSHFGPGSGLSVGKNGVLELNDVHHASDLQKGGSMLQSTAHDLMEANEAGWTKAWAPTLCNDFNNHDQSSNAFTRAWISCTDPAMKGCIWVRIFVPCTRIHPYCAGHSFHQLLRGRMRRNRWIHIHHDWSNNICMCLMCVSILTNICTCILKCIHINVTYTHLHILIRTCTRTCTRRRIHICACTCAHTYILCVCFCGAERNCPIYLRRIPWKAQRAPRRSSQHQHHKEIWSKVSL